MIDISKEYRYVGTHPNLRGKSGVITKIIDEKFVEFSTYIYDTDEKYVLTEFRVMFSNLVATDAG